MLLGRGARARVGASGAGPTTSAATGAASPAASASASTPARQAVRLRVTRVVGGLDHPWDVHPIGKGRLLVTERSGNLAVVKDGQARRLPMPTDLIWVSGETGLMGLAIDPDFADNGRFYTCNGGQPQANPDVRIMVWKMNAAATRATYEHTLLKGFPTSSGRHGGCRLLILDNGALLVGTGDAAIGTNPENKQSFGGKTLMLDRVSGRAVADQPVRQRHEPHAALRPDLRPPQRPGPRAALRRLALVGRARPGPRRRGEPAQERR